jgi:hypothetical protein
MVSLASPERSRSNLVPIYQAVRTPFLAAPRAYTCSNGATLTCRASFTPLLRKVRSKTRIVTIFVWNFCLERFFKERARLHEHGNAALTAVRYGIHPQNRSAFNELLHIRKLYVFVCLTAVRFKIGVNCMILLGIDLLSNGFKDHSFSRCF